MSEPVPLTSTRRAWEQFRANRPAQLAGIFLGMIVMLALLSPLLRLPPFATHLPNALTWASDITTDTQFAPPSSIHWFGTDVHGRDLFSRVCDGASISLIVGLIGAGVSLVIGVLWGAIAGYAGGRWDNILMRVVDILYSMPSIIFVILLITALNGMVEKMQAGAFPLSGSTVQWLQLAGLIGGLGIVSWLTMARIVRGQVLTLRTRPFVEAGQVLGLSHSRILLRHILPNIYGIIIVYLTLTIPSIILSESFLSYLGLGVQEPRASLGSLIADGAQQINPIRIYWWLILCPGMTLTLTLLSLNFLGDGLRDALDPNAASVKNS